MNTYLISIGSNIDRDSNMDKCHQLLSATYPDILSSERIETKPFGLKGVPDFLNQLVIVKTNDTVDDILTCLKNIERQLGRFSDDKQKGLIKIDADLLAVNNTIVKEEDFVRPYLKILLDKINYPLSDCSGLIRNEIII